MGADGDYSNGVRDAKLEGVINDVAQLQIDISGCKSSCSRHRADQYKRIETIREVFMNILHVRFNEQDDKADKTDTAEKAGA